MRLHHVGGYTPEERDGYREIIYANLVRSPRRRRVTLAHVRY